MVQKKSNKLPSIFFEKAFLNLTLIGGKLHLAENSFVFVIKLLQKNYYKNHKKLFKTAVLNIAPVVLLIRKSQKKSVTEIPFIVKKKNRLLKGIKCLLQLLKQNPQKSFKVLIVEELILIIKEDYNKKVERQSVYEYAFIFKKYANYRWF